MNDKIRFTPCTCPLEVRMANEHVPTCKLFKPLWVRRREELMRKYGRVAEHALDRS